MISLGLSLGTTAHPNSLLTAADMDESEEMPTEEAPIEEVATEGAASNMEDVD
jgi:hypothetical protein